MEKWKELKLLTDPFNWGNYSYIEKEKIYVKPSGMSVKEYPKALLSCMDINGKILNPELKPSVDAKIHLEIFKKYPKIKAIVHTHSKYATAYAQANKSLLIYGTTHADITSKKILITKKLSKTEISSEYEKNIGKSIVKLFNNREITNSPGCLIYKHGVFSWGTTLKKAIDNAILIEKIAEMNYFTENINNNSKLLEENYLLKHHERKYGKNRYYGQ